MSSVDYIEEQDLVARPLRLAEAPLGSLLIAVRDAAGADRAGTPEAWRRVLRAHLTRRDYDVLAPLATREPTVFPSALIAHPDGPVQTLPEALKQIVAAEAELAEEMHECVEAGAVQWSGPARDPRGWARGFVLALARAWPGFRPIWEAGRRSLADEMERITVAAERRAHLQVVAEMIPYGHAGGDRWMLECDTTDGSRLGVPDRGLTLIPLVAGSRASIVDHDADALRLVCYPLRRAPNGHGGPTLEALLGIPRARVLRALDHPASNNGLAEALQTVPSAATHHVSALVAAGLVERDRSEGRLLVRRTPRGDALLALYEPGW
jgi:DNA-binding transcriptional ArsR family regulator